MRNGNSTSENRIAVWFFVCEKECKRERERKILVTRRNTQAREVMAMAVFMMSKRARKFNARLNVSFFCKCVFFSTIENQTRIHERKKKKFRRIRSSMKLCRIVDIQFVVIQSQSHSHFVALINTLKKTRMDKSMCFDFRTYYVSHSQKNKQTVHIHMHIIAAHFNSQQTRICCFYAVDCCCCCCC